MHPSQKEKIIHDKVLDILKKNTKGLTMTELVKSSGFSRKAIEKHLQVLILENEIYMKQFGVTKVYYPNHRIQHFDFERLSYNNKTIWFNILEGEFGVYLLIQKKRKGGNDWVHEHSISIPLSQCERFLDILNKILHTKRMKELVNKKQKSEQE